MPQPTSGSKLDEALKSAKDPEVLKVLKEDDYYKLLGIEKGAEEKVIKKKFRKFFYFPGI